MQQVQGNYDSPFFNNREIFSVLLSQLFMISVQGGAESGARS